MPGLDGGEFASEPSALATLDAVAQAVIRDFLQFEHAERALGNECHGKGLLLQAHSL